MPPLKITGGRFFCYIHLVTGTKIAPDLKKHQGIINTVKTCDKLQSLMKTADYNSMALNYAIWVTMTYNYDINQLKAGVKDAKMEKFADCINAYYITTLYNYK